MVNNDYCEKTVFAIEEEDGLKYCHFSGYGYYAGTEIVPGKPYRFVEYTFCYAPLEEVIRFGFSECESYYGPESKQYVTDCTEKEMYDIYKHYDNGSAPKELSEITMETPCGCYILY